MMDSVQLCVDCPGPLEEVAKTIGPLLDIQFTVQKRLNGDVLRATFHGVELILIDFQFDEEDGSTFHGFRYYISIYARSDEAMRTYARNAFESLKTTNRFKLLLVEDFDNITDKHDPTKR